MSMPPRLAHTGCPLCGSADTTHWHRDARRGYRRCGVCLLVYVPAAEHLSPADEKAEYELHQNRLDDPGYRRFLSRIAEPVLAVSAAQRQAGAGLTGIDIGCGPTPLLARMLGDAGIVMQVWDPVYAPDRQVLRQRYDVVTASEVVEHFRDPAAGFAQLFALTAPGGLLAVMTKRVRDAEAFARWHYIHDPTHVAFFSDATFVWLAARYGAQLSIIGDDVVAFRLPAGENAAMTAVSRP